MLHFLIDLLNGSVLSVLMLRVVTPTDDLLELFSIYYMWFYEECKPFPSVSVPCIANWTFCQNFNKRLNNEETLGRDRGSVPCQ
jgi:hypothetical protein